MFCFHLALAFGLLMLPILVLVVLVVLVVLAQAGTALRLARQVGHLEGRDRIEPGMLSQ